VLGAEFELELIQTQIAKKPILGFCEKLLAECLRSLTTRAKTPVLAVIFRLPLPSVSP
jgi:hypothetical protein